MTGKRKAGELQTGPSQGSQRCSYGMGLRRSTGSKPLVQINDAELAQRATRGSKPAICSDKPTLGQETEPASQTGSEPKQYSSQKPVEQENQAQQAPDPPPLFQNASHLLQQQLEQQAQAPVPSARYQHGWQVPGLSGGYHQPQTGGAGQVHPGVLPVQQHAQGWATPGAAPAQNSGQQSGQKRTYNDLQGNHGPVHQPPRQFVPAQHTARSAGPASFPATDQPNLNLHDHSWAGTRPASTSTHQPRNVSAGPSTNLGPISCHQHQPAAGNWPTIHTTSWHMQSQHHQQAQHHLQAVQHQGQQQQDMVWTAGHPTHNHGSAAHGHSAGLSGAAHHPPAAELTGHRPSWDRPVSGVSADSCKPCIAPQPPLPAMQHNMQQRNTGCVQPGTQQQQQHNSTAPTWPQQAPHVSRAQTHQAHGAPHSSSSAQVTAPGAAARNRVIHSTSTPRPACPPRPPASPPVLPACYFSMGRWLPVPPGANTGQQKQQQQAVIKQLQEHEVSLCSSPPDTAKPGGQPTDLTNPQHVHTSTASQPQAPLPPADYNSAFRRPLRQALSSWVQHPDILAEYADKGLQQLYPWQAAALECGEDGNNLVYCAPTSGGKSVVAEVLMIRQLLKFKTPRGPFGRHAGTPARALLILPYISIVSEKTAHMTQVLSCLDGTVKGYMGEDGSTPLTDRSEMLAVVTMEKANVALNKMIQQQRLHELVCVVVDEAHMVADPSRGMALELLLTKLMHAARALPEVASTLQVVAMSATMSGIEQMRAWLNARLYMTNFRPVPLTEHAVFKRTVFRKLSPQELSELRAKRQAEEREQEQQTSEKMSTEAPHPAAAQTAGPVVVKPAVGVMPAPGAGEPPAWADVLQEERTLDAAHPQCDGLLPLVAEVVVQGHSVLVFCAARSTCQVVARKLAEQLPALVPGGWSAEVQAARAKILSDLRARSGDVANEELEYLINAGVGYHHAGLTSQERSAVEGAYRSGAILVITATSTLAAGINLPARRVILRSLQQGIGPVSRAQYLQMIGRAGRAGQSAVGEAFIIGQGNPREASGQWPLICKLLVAPLPPLKSRLLDKASGTLLPRLHKPAAPALPARPAARDSSTEAAPVPSAAAGTAPVSAASGADTVLPDKQDQSICNQATKDELQQQGPDKVASDNPPALPPTTSCSVATEAGAGEGKPGAADVPAAAPAPPAREFQLPEETQLQHMLLEAVSNGSISCEVSMDRLLRSTLIYHQVSWKQLCVALRQALANLQEAGLINILPPVQVELDVDTAAVCAVLSVNTHQQLPPGLVTHKGAPPGTCRCLVSLPKRCEPTPVGKAVFGSSLPLHHGMELYKRLLVAQEEGLVLAAGPLHAILIVMTTEHEAFQIQDWRRWSRLLRSLNDVEKKVLEKGGVSIEYADTVQFLRGGAQQQETARHSRMAAALCLARLICEGDLSEMEEMWGQASGILQKGVTRGTLQGLQKQLNKSAGMASQLCACAGWWQLELLMSSLSEQASAGARPELFRLLQLESLKDAPARARELYERGIREPAALATAPESLVQQALMAALPRNMKDKPAAKPPAKGTAAMFSSSTYANHVLVNRVAAALIQEARDLVLGTAMDVLQTAAKTTAAAAVGSQGKQSEEPIGSSGAGAGGKSGADIGAAPEEAHGSAGAGGSAGAAGRPGSQSGSQPVSQHLGQPPGPSARAVAHAVKQAARVKQGLLQLHIRGHATVFEVGLHVGSQVLQKVDAHIRAATRVAITCIWQQPPSQTGAVPSQQAAQAGDGKSPAANTPLASDQFVAPSPTPGHLNAAFLPPRLSGLIVAWNEMEAAWIRLDQVAAHKHNQQPEPADQAGCDVWQAAGVLTRHPCWPSLHAALTNSSIVKCLYNATSDLALLSACGVDIWQLASVPGTSPPDAMPGSSGAQGGTGSPPPTRCSLHDPQLMMWLFTCPPGGPDSISLKLIQQEVLPKYSMRVPLGRAPPHVIDALKTCLIAYSGSRALEAVGQATGLMRVYNQVEVKLLVARAMATAGHWLHLAARTPSASGRPGAGSRPLTSQLHSRPAIVVCQPGGGGAKQEAQGQAAGTVPPALVVSRERWRHASAVARARLEEVIWCLAQLVPQIRHVPLSWWQPEMHSWVCQQLHLQPRRPATHMPCYQNLQEAPAPCLIAGLMRGSGPGSDDDVNHLPSPAYAAGPSHVYQHARFQHDQHVACWLLTQLKQLQDWMTEAVAPGDVSGMDLVHVMEAACASGDQPQPAVLNPVPGVSGRHGLLTCSLDRFSGTPACFTDLIHMAPNMQSLQQHLDRVALPAHIAAVARGGQALSTRDASGLHRTSSMQGWCSAQQDAHDQQQRAARLAQHAQQMCGQLVLFDGSQAFPASLDTLQQAGLWSPAAQLLVPSADVDADSSCGAAAGSRHVNRTPVKVVCSTPGWACDLTGPSLTSQPTLLCSTLLAVLLPSTGLTAAVPDTPATDHLRTPPAGTQLATQGAGRQGAVALVASSHHASRRSGVLMVPCHSAWLHAEASGVCTVAHALQQGSFHTLNPVQVCLGTPRCWLSPSSPAACLLHVRYLHLPLTVLSHLCGDSSLSELVKAHQPYAAIARVWAAELAGDAADQASSPPGRPAEPAQPDVAGLLLPRKLQDMLASCSQFCIAQGLDWAVEQLLASFLLGETPIQVAERLSGLTPGAADSRKHRMQLNKKAAKQAQTSLLECLKAPLLLSTHLLQEALKTGGVLKSVCGRSFRVPAVAEALVAPGRGAGHKPLTPSVQASLQRSLVREVVLGSCADVMRTAAALAVAASACCGSSASSAPTAHLGPALPDGRLLLMLPRTSGSVRRLEQGPPAAGQHVERLCSPPDDQIVAAVHRAVTTAVAEQLSLPELSVVMTWGDSCDPDDSLTVPLQCNNNKN